MENKKEFRLPFAYKIQEAKEKYRVRKLVKMGLIILAVIFILIDLFASISLLIGGAGLVGLFLGLVLSVFMTLIYGSMATGFILGIYYLISHFVLNDSLFEKPKYLIFEKNYMKNQAMCGLLHKEEYQAYLEFRNI